MRLLTTAAEINSELVRLIHECSSCQIAVAWASVDFEAFESLKSHSGKIQKLVVGTHFYQTNPAFIEAFLSHPNARFVRDTDSLFHPKIYLFEKADGRWECIVGSANFTKAGLHSNTEIAVMIGDDDEGAQTSLVGAREAIAGYWQELAPFSQAELQAYREAWKRKRPILKNLRGKFGNPQDDNADDNGNVPWAVGILAMTWAAFFNEVQNEKPSHFGHSMTARLHVIRTAQQLFARQQPFKALALDDRKKIAGLLITDTADYRLFGSMIPTWQFKDAVASEDERLDHISLALDAIPLTGAVSRDMYFEYITRFQKAFPSGGHGVATATRLLAMKRPDYFVCVDGKNEKSLCEKFGIKGKRGGKVDVSYEMYWDSIIGRLMTEAVWWQSPAPGLGVEREVWDARAAFLDSLLYSE